MIRYVDLDKFDPTLPLTIAVCPTTVNIKNLKNKDKIGANCIIDSTSSLYMNQSQESEV